MKHSTKRILTTHAGRLDGPPEYREVTMAMMSGQKSGSRRGPPKIRSGMVDVLRKQTEAGIDIISDGELGKVGFGRAYYGLRLSGLSSRERKPDEPGFMTLKPASASNSRTFIRNFRSWRPARSARCAPARFTI